MEAVHDFIQSKIIESKDVYVYGGGLRGKLVAAWLASKKNIIARAIVVSSGHLEENEYISFEGNRFAIKELDKISFENADNVLFINTVISGKETVEQLLKEKGLCIIDGFASYIPQILSDYAEYYYAERKLDFDKEILLFDNVKVFNPCKINPSFKSTVFGTMGDEIVPAVYNDFSLTVDGAYEFGGVVCNEDEVVIDAGANIGLFACYAANKGCKVYACEPDSQALEVLEEQKKLYPNNLFIIEKGLSDKEGEVKFYESSDCSLSSIGMPRGNVKETTIELTTIDSLVEKGILERVDYIKADIEGAERDMLRGAVNTLKKFAPKLSICTYHYPEDKELLTSIIKEANPDYVVEYRWRKLYAYVPDEATD